MIMIRVMMIMTIPMMENGDDNDDGGGDSFVDV